MQYRLESRAIDGCRHELVMHGRVYSSASQELRRLLDEAASRARWIIVDTSGLDSIDAVALHSFVDVLRRLRRQGGGLAFVGLRPDVLRFFEVTGLDRVVSLYASRDEALHLVA
jgi:anti-anti-sigma factor